MKTRPASGNAKGAGAVPNGDTPLLKWRETHLQDFSTLWNPAMLGFQLRLLFTAILTGLFSLLWWVMGKKPENTPPPFPQFFLFALLLSGIAVFLLPPLFSLLCPPMIRVYADRIVELGWGRQETSRLANVAECQLYEDLLEGEGFRLFLSMEGGGRVMLHIPPGQVACLKKVLQEAGVEIHEE